jgi:CheY-like chemotaxis protein/anti-sigma regulatory factor (Ser/Thr protein kinase)
MRPAKHTVLVVDDSAIDRRLASGLLEREGDYQILLATNGKDALVALKSQPVDLVLTDLQMEEMDGLQLVEAVRTDFPLTPVILMTALGSEEIAVKALEKGAASYVAKRRLQQDLMEIVQQVIDNSDENRLQSRLMHRLARNEFSFVLNNDLSLVHSLVKYLQHTLRCVRLEDEVDRLRVGIAVEEALLNALYHGNLEVSSDLKESDPNLFEETARQRCQQEPYCHRRIFVDALVSRELARFVIRDEGRGFDPQQLPDPCDPANLEKPSGRGILLMRSFMDEISFNEDGNQVTLVKHGVAQDATDDGA